MKAILIALTLIIVPSHCQIEFSDGPRNFSIELLYHTAVEKDWHVVISPFGVWSLMSGAAIGATDNTFEQLRQVFILPKNQRSFIKSYLNLTSRVLNPATPEVSLTSNNFMFVDKNFKIYEEFKSILETDFKSVIKVLDFNDPSTAAKTANNFIRNSGGRVSNVLTSDDFSESRLILSNVISFKGLWGFPFNVTDTTVESFHDENKKVIGQVNMMYQRAPIPYSSIKKLKAFTLDLPYGKDGKYSMLLILPYPNVKLSDVYQNLVTISLKDIMKTIQRDSEEYGLTDIDVRIPRFKISTNVVLNKPLNDMGVFDVFDPSAASFNRISKEPLFISAIIHKADIEVSESGTVASAATVADFADRISTPSFLANKPFMYSVLERSTTTVIFGGVYSKPNIF